MKQWQHILKRLILLIPVLWLVTLATFVIARVLPGNPAYLLAGTMSDQSEVDRITQDLGLDQPIWTQYAVYMGALLRGDLGRSLMTSNPVVEDLMQRFPATFELTTVSLMLAIILSVPLGVLSAVRRDTIFDHVSRATSLFGVSMPVFWLGLLLIFFLQFKLQLFPPAMGRLPLFVEAPERVTGMYLVDSLLAGDLELFWMALKQIALPAFTLAFVNMAPVGRLIRSSMIEVLGSDYIRSARACGLSERKVTYQLALKNALLPAITIVGVIFGYLLGGSVLVEKVFAWPGMGLYAVTGVTSRDYPAVQGFVLVATFMYVLVFLGVDILYSIIDPRIKY